MTSRDQLSPLVAVDGASSVTLDVLSTEEARELLVRRLGVRRVAAETDAVATGVSMFPGSRAGTGSELRINSVLHVNSRLAPGTVVPIGWIAAGDPAELYSPDRHDDLWAVQNGR